MTTTAKRVHKKSLKEDQLVTTTFKLTEWAQAHFNQVIIAVVALVAVVAVLVFAANSRENSARQAEREMGAALALLQQGDVPSARNAFQQIYEKHGGPQAVAARFFKAECELREGNYQQAIDDYDGYLAKVSDYPLFEVSAIIGKAYAYEGLDNYNEAAPLMASAVEKLPGGDPRRLDAAFSAGEFYAHEGRSSDARKYFDMVIKDGSGDLKARATVAASMLN
jgi:tetratricopeptide (TPR) repeat protein